MEDCLAQRDPLAYFIGHSVGMVMFVLCCAETISDCQVYNRMRFCWDAITGDNA